jgi:hypothetical protein
MSSPASPSSPAPEPDAPSSDAAADARLTPDADGANEPLDQPASEATSNTSEAVSALSSPRPDAHSDDAAEDDSSSNPEAVDVLSSPDISLPIQIPSRPSSPLLPLILSLPGPLIDMDTGTMDDAIERHFLTEAEELGLEVPPEPKSILKSSQNNDSTATVSSSSPETQTIPSRASESTRPTSRSSSVNNHRPTTATKSTTNKTAPSTPKQPSSKKSPPRLPPPPPEPINDRLAGMSISSDGSSSRLVKGLKRFSNYTKRRTMMLNKSIPMPGDTSHQSSEKDTASDPGTISSPTLPVELDASEELESATASKPRRKHVPSAMPSLAETSSFVSSSPRSPKSAGLGGLTPNEAKEYDAEESKQRSLRSRHLQAIRLHQLDEQSEFLEYYFGVFDKIRSKYTKERDAAEREFNQDRKVVEERHSEQHQEMEHRHLGKEMDLQRALEQERQACETKLKHMDAYCNGRQGGDEDDAPRRTVTEDDYRKLLHQYHVRQTMGGLHDSKINVLRERQAKQMERLTESHDEELAVMQERFEEEEARRNAAQNSEEDKIRNEFDLKKHRLIWRWKLMETVERRKLELESGETYGDLPDVQWGEEEWLHTAL